MIASFSLVLHVLNIKKEAVAILLKGVVAWNIFPPCFKVAFKVEWISTGFSKFQEEAITLMNSRGMEITIGHFTAKLL